MSLLVAVFLFGCFVTFLVTTGLLFAASAFELDSKPRFEGQGLDAERSGDPDEGDVALGPRPLPPKIL